MNGGEKINILITGTPGTGKTTLSAELASRMHYNHLCIGDLVKANEWYDSYDEERQCHVIDEDKIIDNLEEKISEGGNIVEYHGGDFFPERWFQYVFVLRTDNSVLHQRLSSRGYSAEKVMENIECEIFQVILDEIKEAYEEDITFELHNNNMNDFENNIEKIISIVQSNDME